MKFENTEVFNFDGAIRGMRNPKNSHNKSDSKFVIEDDGEIGLEKIKYDIGQNDMKLAQTLIRSGSEHRKFLRQIFVCVDITAPLYFWKEFDTYKVGTVANSESTMHKLADTPIDISCFELYDCEAVEVGIHDSVMNMIDMLERLRVEYNETKDVRYWKELIRWLPESWLQKRTVTMNYENLLAICSKGQRRFHKLTEWRECFVSWARSLPYAQEFIFIDEVQ